MQECCVFTSLGKSLKTKTSCKKRGREKAAVFSQRSDDGNSSLSSYRTQWPVNTPLLFSFSLSVVIEKPRFPKDAVSVGIYNEKFCKHTWPLSIGMASSVQTEEIWHAVILRQACCVT